MMCACTHTHTHWLHAAKAYLQCSQEVKQSGVVVGGGARAAVCEIEAPDVSQGSSRGMGAKWQNNQEARQEGSPGRVGTSHAAIMGISSREPKHSYCSRCRPAHGLRRCHGAQNKHRMRLHFRVNRGEMLKLQRPPAR